MLALGKKSLIVAAILAGSSSAAFAVAFEVEGKLTAANENEVICNGVKITLQPTTVFTTPTNTITLKQLLSDVPFPGQVLIPPADAGMLSGGSKNSAFIGGTCIIDGESDDATGVMNAASFFAEIAENVMVGPSTSELGQPLKIAGVQVVILGDYDDGVNKSEPDPYAFEWTVDNSQKPMPVRDANGKLVPKMELDPATNRLVPVKPRIHAVAPSNEFGYDVRLSTVPKNDLSSAEGHLYGSKFYAHVVETSGGERMDNDAIEPSATVQRADGRIRSATRIQLEVRGGCDFRGVAGDTLPLLIQVDNGANWINPNSPQVPLANTTTNATCTREVPGSQNGIYVYRRDYNKPTAYASPTKVRVRVAHPAGTPSTVPAYKDSLEVTLTLRQ